MPWPCLGLGCRRLLGTELWPRETTWGHKEECKPGQWTKPRAATTDFGGRGVQLGETFSNSPQLHLNFLAFPPFSWSPFTVLTLTTDMGTSVKLLLPSYLTSFLLHNIANDCGSLYFPKMAIATSVGPLALLEPCRLPAGGWRYFTAPWYGTVWHLVE